MPADARLDGLANTFLETAGRARRLQAYAQCHFGGACGISGTLGAVCPRLSCLRRGEVCAPGEAPWSLRRQVPSAEPQAPVKPRDFFHRLMGLVLVS